MEDRSNADSRDHLTPDLQDAAPHKKKKKKKASTIGMNIYTKLPENGRSGTWLRGPLEAAHSFNFFFFFLRQIIF